MRNQSDIALIILAAGESSRMGRTKQLLPWKDTTLLGNAIASARQCEAKEIYIVVGAKAKGIIENHKEQDVNWIINKHWEQGMGSSLSAAAKHISEAKHPYGGVLVMLCDQPLIDSTYLNKIIQTFCKTEYSIVATDYGHGKGVPAIFDKSHLDDLGRLDKHFGARDIIASNTHRVISLDPNGKEQDVDTMEAYKKLIQTHLTK